MAYSNLLNQTVNNESDLLDKLHDFLVTTLGWTDHDDQRSGSDYFVVTSSGEDGKGKLCMKFRKNTSSHRIEVLQFLSWDNGTHTGKKQSGKVTYSYIYSSGSTHICWLYGDKDHIKVITKVGTTYYCFYGGRYDTVYNKDYTTTQAAVSSGDNVSVDVDDASCLSEGEWYLIMDDTNCERAKISSISGNTITFEHLDNSYGSGARVGEDPIPNVISVSNLDGSKTNALFQQFYYDGTPGINYYVRTHEGIDPQLEGYIDNAHRYSGRRYFFPIAIVNNNASYEEMLGYLKYIFTFDKSKQSVVSEDTITYDGKTYDVFVIGTSDYVIVIPRTV